MALLAHDDQTPAGYFYVLPDSDADPALVQALDADPRLVVPILPQWGDYLLQQTQETLANFPDGCVGGPDRMVEALRVYGDLLAEAYVYARDNDTWLSLMNQGLESGAIVLGGGEGQ